MIPASAYTFRRLKKTLKYRLETPRRQFITRAYRQLGRMPTKSQETTSSSKDVRYELQRLYGFLPSQNSEPVDKRNAADQEDLMHTDLSTRSAGPSSSEGVS